MDLHTHASHHRPEHLPPEVPSRLRYVRHAARAVSLALVGHFLMHTGWYTFERVTDWSGVDPRDIAGMVNAAGPLAIPAAVATVGASAWLEDRLH